MTRGNFRTGWYPLMRAETLRRSPAQRTLAGRELQLSRLPDGSPSAIDSATRHPCRLAEQDAWVFAALGDPPLELPNAFPRLSSPSRRLLIEGRVGAGLADVAENILDTTHTSVVHSGYLRQPGARRPVEAELTSGEDWVAAIYPPGAAPSGWGARLLGAHRYKITDTFRAPAIAEVSYTKHNGPVFCARFWLTPVSARETFVAATIAVPGSGPIAHLKLAALRVFFLRIFAQDRAILEMIGKNRLAHGFAPLIYTPQDLLRPGIDAILESRRPVAPPPLAALKV